MSHTPPAPRGRRPPAPRRAHDDRPASPPTGLARAHEHVREELKRADAKATTLLTLPAGAAAGVIALTGRPVGVPATVALWAAAMPLALSVVLLLLVLLPRDNHQPPQGSWLHAAQVGPAELLDSYTRAPESALLLAHDVCVLARLARDKFRWIRRAVLALLAGLGLLVVALVLSVVAP